jgi:TPR repeat protein
VCFFFFGNITHSSTYLFCRCAFFMNNNNNKKYHHVQWDPSKPPITICRPIFNPNVNTNGCPRRTVQTPDDAMAFLREYVKRNFPALYTQKIQSIGQAFDRDPELYDGISDLILFYAYILIASPAFPHDTMVQTRVAQLVSVVAPHDDKDAMRILGLCFMHGIGVPQNTLWGKQWLEKCDDVIIHPTP